ncbi:MAG: carboxypeptidase-like regulatory domain-containing protein [Acidobacteriota bacterium]
MKNLAACIFLALSLHAQNPYGRITGRVTDSADAVVPGAAVQVVQLDTNVVTSTVSNQEGNFELLNLVPGHYRLIVELQGFKRYERGPLEVRVGDVVSLPVKLELGALAESVTVTAEAPLLESATASVGQVIENRRIMDLPIAGGSLNYLIQLSPNVTTLNAPTHGWLPQARDSVSNLSVAGTRSRSSEFTLDGIPNMAQEGIIAFAPPPEVVQEFRVQTAAYDSSVGHFTGAHVNMVLKNGTNEFHGNLYFGHLSRPLMTKPFFTNRSLYDLSTGPPTREKSAQLWPYTLTNRYRGNAGGPVYLPRVYDGRNRTFWHFGTDFMLRTFPVQGFRTVPTLKQRRGDFSDLLALGAQYQIYDPATIAPAPGGRFSRQPLAGNTIPASRLDPGALKLLDYYPLPNAAGTVDGRNNYTGAPASRIDYNSQILRIDQVFSENHRMYGSFSQSHVLGRQGVILANIARGTLSNTRYRGLALDDVITLRPDLVVNVRYGFTRLRPLSEPLSIGFDLSTVGFAPALVRQLDPKLTALPEIAVDQYESIGAGSGSRTATNYHSITGTVSNIRGNHSLRFGGEYRTLQENNYNYGNVSPSLNFGVTWTRGPLDTSPAAPIGQGLASLLLSVPTGGGIDINPSYAEQSGYAAWFLHDDWKVTRKLTVNLGLRYEVEVPTTERFNRTNRGFDFTTANPIQDAARTAYARNPIPEAPAGQFQTLGGLLFAGAGGIPRGLWDTDASNLSPRLGLAWLIRQKTVVRAGYGVFFESNGADRIDVSQQGFSQRTSVVPSLDNGLTFRASLRDPFPDGLLQPAGASAGLRTFLGRSPGFFSPSRRNGYMQRWSFNVQQEFPHRLLFEVGYTGNRGTGLGLGQQYNPVPARYLSTSLVRDQAAIDFLSAVFPNPFFGMREFDGSGLQGRTVARSQLLRPYPHFSGISSTLSGGFSWYHALHLRAEKRFSHGYTLTASYTWSKFMEAVERLNDSDPHPHHVVSPQDRPHHLVASGIFEFPLGRRKHWGSAWPGWADAVLGGWSVQAIYSGQSGAPVGFGNISFLGNLHEIVVPRSQRRVERWFNPEAGFVRDPRLTLGSNLRAFPLRLTGLRADGYNTWDLSLFKTFRIAERFKLQLRAEGQDALNHAMFGGPNANPVSTLFGTVNTTAWTEQRKITLSARLSW